MTIFAIESQKNEILHIFLSKCIVSMVKTIKYSPKAAKILEITLKFPHCRKFYPKLTIFYTSTHLWCLWQISSLSPWPTPSPPICNRRQAEVPLWRRGLAKKTIGSCSLVKLSLKSSSSSSWSSSSSFSCSSFSCSSSSSSSSYSSSSSSNWPSWNGIVDCRDDFRAVFFMSRACSGLNCSSGEL